MAQIEAPPIAALFQVVFDQKVGYTIAWKQTQPGTDLDGVEYQCLPSGLHSVREDLVYFIHNNYAGVSAFMQGDADEAHRNASFVAVGALVPLSYGRLGKSWEHARDLRRLARTTVKNLKDVKPLEDFWTKYQKAAGSNGAVSPTIERPSPLKRKRALSDATGAFTADNSMTQDHPAMSMTALITTFGPLLFPLYREALLRRRILLLGSTPVQRTCNFVYDLSILSNVPRPLQESLSTENGRTRLQPLFNVGVFDITRLEAHEDGWMACTTDDILGEKRKLYDLLVELPSPNTASAQKHWPKLRTPGGQVIKATQRDLRRYYSLCKELKKIERSTSTQYHDVDPEDTDDNHDESVPLIHPMPGSWAESRTSQIAEAEIVQPEPWSTAAYKSFMWWASAGEMDALEAEETLIDQELLEDLPDVDNIGDCEYEADDDDDAGKDAAYLTRGAQQVAIILVAYFHRVTEAILQTLANNIEHADDDTEEGYQEEAIEISTDDMRRMGLDPWNTGDRQFVQDVMKVYFKREATIEDDGVQMCGMKLC